jgi:hypothetical protein
MKVEGNASQEKLDQINRHLIEDARKIVFSLARNNCYECSTFMIVPHWMIVVKPESGQDGNAAVC